MSDKSKEAAKEAKQEEAKQATKGAAKEATTEAEKPEGTEDVAPAKAGPPMLLMIGAIVIAVLAGGALGGFVVGPKFTPSTGAAAADAHGEEEAEDEEGGHGGGAKGGGGAHGKGGSQYTYQIENIIVNPSGSGGSRFLMATIAFELSDEKPASQLRDRDVQVRDVVISVLERKTLIDLTEPGSREVIKKELHDAVKPLAGAATWMRVYLPQFVLQ